MIQARGLCKTATTAFFFVALVCYSTLGFHIASRRASATSASPQSLEASRDRQLHCEDVAATSSTLTHVSFKRQGQAAARAKTMAEASPARRLLEQIERSSRNAEEPVGEFSDEAMSQLKAECAKLYSEVLRLMDGGDARVADLPDATKASLVVHHQRVLRNKECALFYLRERLEVLTRLRCEAGSNLPRNVRRHCSPQESQFNAAYDQLYQDFCRASRLDPRDSLKPPRDLYVEVRCNVDCGDVQTKHSGTVRMDKGTSHFLRRADVEQLIAQGLVTHVTTGVAP